MSGTKPIPVSKRMVWEAYKKVKANQGAAGVDGVSLKMFEERLSDNLYKVWNRLTSGSYFPPPVKEVEILKAGGKIRKLWYSYNRGQGSSNGSKRLFRTEDGNYFS